MITARGAMPGPPTATVFPLFEWCPAVQDEAAVEGGGGLSALPQADPADADPLAPTGKHNGTGIGKRPFPVAPTGYPDRRPLRISRQGAQGRPYATEPH